MELMTKALEKMFENFPLGSQGGMNKEAEVVVKYFNPCGAGTWLITEGEKQRNGDWLLFGYCHIYHWGWGDVLLSQLQGVKLPFGLSIERDPPCEGMKVKELVH